MVRWICLLIIASGLAVAQPPTAPTASKPAFLITLTLAGSPADLTQEQMGLLQQHAAHLQKAIASGMMVFGGRTKDMANLRGIAVFRAASEQEVRDFLMTDPSIKAGVMKFAIEGFDLAFPAAK